MSIPGLLTVPLLQLDPLYDPLRDNPRFQARMYNALVSARERTHPSIMDVSKPSYITRENALTQSVSGVRTALHQ